MILNGDADMFGAEQLTVELLGVELQLRRIGSGPPVLLLHGEDGFIFNRAFVENLASRFTIIAPDHPAWGSPRPGHVRTLDDIAYLYLELLDQFAELPTVIGLSIGGWIAAEMATKNQSRMTALVLVSPVGIKTSGVRDRAFIDLYASHPDDVATALYADPSLVPSLSSFTDEQFLDLAIAQEAVARYAWEPYMHNPQLAHRLARIRVPSLVIEGEDDGFILEPEYYSNFARLIGDNATLATLDGVGHRADEEAPDRLFKTIAAFLEDPASAHAVPSRMNTGIA
ncbi:MAG TPA: alpha/beta hydrolase [Acidimicrobiales bacterium]|nr:alpha/beta hydrolase [Acidimicrobiales bacterium]